MKAGPSDPGGDVVTAKSLRTSVHAGRGGILLVNVASPARTGSPPLGMQYLAASAMEAGIAIELLDLSSPFGAEGRDAFVRTVARLRPQVIGLALYTETALWAYELVRSSVRTGSGSAWRGDPTPRHAPRRHWRGDSTWSCGARAKKRSSRCFRPCNVAIDLGAVDGIAYRDASGNLRKTAARALPLDLDRLPSPRRAAGLVDRSSYLRKGVRDALPASLVTSRGCPGRCTFCSSNVSGRRYRFHSPGRVLADMRDWNESEGATTFCFHDDAFTAHRRRLIELCSRMADLPFPSRWVCEARADHLDRERLTRDGGCGVHHGHRRDRERGFLGARADRQRHLARDGRAGAAVDPGGRDADPGELHAWFSRRIGRGTRPHAALHATHRAADRRLQRDGHRHALSQHPPVPATPPGIRLHRLVARRSADGRPARHGDPALRAPRSRPSRTSSRFTAGWSTR